MVGPRTSTRWVLCSVGGRTGGYLECAWWAGTPVPLGSVFGGRAHQCLLGVWFAGAGAGARWESVWGARIRCELVGWAVAGVPVCFERVGRVRGRVRSGPGGHWEWVGRVAKRVSWDWVVWQLGLGWVGGRAVNGLRVASARVVLGLV